jgi:hypothetical protein
MKKLLVLLSLFALSCNDSEIKDEPAVIDSTIEVVDTLVDVSDTIAEIPSNIDSLNDARKKSRDSIRDSKSGK